MKKVHPILSAFILINFHSPSIQQLYYESVVDYITWTSCYDNLEYMIWEVIIWKVSWLLCKYRLNLYCSWKNGWLEWMTGIFHSRCEQTIHCKNVRHVSQRKDWSCNSKNLNVIAIGISCSTTHGIGSYILRKKSCFRIFKYTQLIKI